MNRVVRVLVVDDSALVRQVLIEGLSRDEGLEVVGSASNPYEARDAIVRLKPDVMTLDVEMPRMDGVEFLRRLMPQYPIPVVMVSALTGKGKTITLQALEVGAVDFVCKPSTDVTRGLGTMMMELRTKVRIAATANVSAFKRARPVGKVVAPTALAESTDKVVVIGASTGGTEATKRVLATLPRTCPGIVIVQHMPATFTKLYAQSLNQITQLRVKEAENDDRILPGVAFVAPGDFQARVVRSGGQYRVRITREDKVSGHCPSVGVLFQSVAQHVGGNAIGIILTGMGNDGASGLLAMKKAGAITIGQDQSTCVVFGMPREAEKLGAVDQMVPIDDVAGAIMSGVKELDRRSA